MYKILSWLIIVVSAALFIYLLGLRYDACIELISKISGYSKTERIAGLLTPAKFQLLKFTPLTGVIIGGLLLAFIKPVTQGLLFIKEHFVTACNYIIHHIKGLSRREKLAFGAIILANVLVKGYYLLNFPITYDEAWTYLNFTDRSIISSITYYSAPNNHILNSVLTNLFNHLPLPVAVRLRLPAFIAGILFLVVFYVFSRRWFSGKLSVLLLLTLSFLTPQLFYSFAARGYILVLLFSTICYFVTIRLVETRTNETRNLFYFSVCSVLGFYTMPSFLYPYITLNIFLFAYAVINKRIPLLRRQIIWCIITVIAVLVLYTPVFAISGISSVTSNSYVVPISRTEVLQKLWKHLLEVYNYLFNYKYALLIVYPMMIFACFFSKHKKLAILNLCILGLMPFIPILHSVIPFERTWIYLTVPAIISVGLILKHFIPAFIPSVAYYAVGIVLAVVTVKTSYKSLVAIEDFAMNAKDAVNFAWRNNMRSIYIKEPLMDTYLLYKYKAGGGTLDCVIFEKEFLERKSGIEYIMIRKNWQSPIKLGSPVFSNGYFDIYRNPSYINGIKP